MKEQQQQKQIKRLYKEQSSHLVYFIQSQSELSQNDKTIQFTQSTKRKAHLGPAIRDAQKLPQNVFPPRRPTLTSGSVQSVARPFQKPFREVFGNALILIFYLSIKAWEEKSLPKSHGDGPF